MIIAINTKFVRLDPPSITSSLAPKARARAILLAIRCLYPTRLEIVGKKVATTMTMKLFLFIYFTFNFDLKGDEDVTDHGDDQHNSHFLH